MFAVVSQKDGNVYDVSYKGIKGQYRVLLVGGDKPIDIGAVIQMSANLGKPWTAVPNAMRPNTIDGFVDRRRATEYLIRESGHWKNDALRSLCAYDLNGDHIGKTLLWFRNDDQVKELNGVTMIVHKKSGSVHVRYSSSNRQVDLKPHTVLAVKQ